MKIENIKRHILLIVSASLLIGLVGYGFYIGEKMNRVYAPLGEACLKIKLNITSSHLWFEKGLSGIKNADIKDVWKHLKQAEWNAKTMLDDVESIEGLFIPLSDKDLRKEICTLLQNLAEYKILTSERYLSTNTSGVDTTIDYHNEVFGILLKQSDQVEKRLSKIRLGVMNNYRVTQITLIFIGILILIYATHIFYKREIQRGKSYAGVKHINSERHSEIVDRKKSEQVLVGSKPWMDFIFESLTEGVLVASPERKFVSANAAALSMLGYSMKEMEKNSTEMIHVNHEHYVEFGEIINKFFERGEPAHFEFELKRKNGEIFPTEHAASFLLNEKKERIGIISSVRDITDKKISKEKTNKLSRAVEESSNEVFMFDGKTLKFTYINSGALNNLGYTMEEMKKETPVSIKPEYTKKQFEELIVPLLQGEKDQFFFETIHERKDGSTYPIEVHLSFHKGTPCYFLAVVMDITERKEVEEELDKHKNHLEDLIEEATNELKHKNIELRKSYTEIKESNQRLQEAHEKLKLAQSQMVESEKMASIGQLTAGIAHEINNPVNFIGAGINSLEENIRDVLSLYEKYDQINSLNIEEKLSEINDFKEEVRFADLVKYVDKSTKNIKNGVRRTSEIIKGLRVFSHSNQEKTQVVDIHKGINAVLTILNNQYKNQIDIYRNYRALPWIECYPGKLNQVFSNIITNSIDAIKENRSSKKGKITIITEHLKNNREDMIVIKIKDNGVGIHRKIRNKIFDPFYTTKEIGKGTGLGLAICYSIVKNHNGRIEINSSPGKGTEFEIYLPIEYSHHEIEKI